MPSRGKKMAKVSLKHIYKVYDGKVKAVSDFNLEIEDKEFIVFVGPSGCGKSTTLRMVAGLEDITAGELRIGDALCNHVEPKNRNISMVFQNYALFPNMTVYDNIAFGLKMHKVPKEEIDKKVLDAAEILGITEYLKRKPKALSGGQRQRVALGRAIVREPNVFLFDEPLSNLDAKLRAKMRTEITRLHKRLQTTFIYVTHDQVEAMTMGDRIVVMKGGFVQQTDTPQNLYRYPENKFVAGFIGTPQMNFFSAVLKRDGADVKAVTPDFTVTIPAEFAYGIDEEYIDGGRAVIMGIRPDDLTVCREGGQTNCIKAAVSLVEELGGQTLIYADTREEALLQENSETSFCASAGENTGIRAGDEIYFAVNAAKIHLFDAETENTVKRRVPTVKTVCKVKKGEAELLGGKTPLPPALKSKLCDGEYSVVVSPQSLQIAEEGFEGFVEEADNLGKTYAYRVRCGTARVFVTDKAAYKAGDTVKIKPRFDKLTFLLNGEVAAQAVENSVRFEGKFLREKVGKEKKHFISFCGIKTETPFGFNQKMYDCGRSIFKKELIFETEIENFLFAEDGAEAKVLETSDFDETKYLKLDLNGLTFHMPAAEQVAGDAVKIKPDFDLLKVIDADLDMLLF